MHRDAMQRLGGDGAAQQREDEGDDDPEHSAILAATKTGMIHRGDYHGVERFQHEAAISLASRRNAPQIAKEMLDILNAAM